MRGNGRFLGNQDLSLVPDRLAGSEDVDVVIPAYNAAEFIAQAIASVFAQTHRPSRVIVVDDGSTDRTAAVVGALAEQHPELMLRRLERNCGLPAARNAGIAWCGSPFVAFLDADDVWAPTKLELQIAVFRAAGDRVGFVHSAYFLMDRTGKRLDGINTHVPRLKGEILRPLLIESYALAGSASAVLVRRELLERAGLFDETLTYAEDLDLWLRLAAMSHVDFTPEPVVGIRLHTDSMQGKREPGKQLRYFMQRLRIFGRWDAHLQSDPDFISRLRNDSFGYLLSEGRNLSRIPEFYDALEASGEPLARKLFVSRFDLWWRLAAEVLARLPGKLARSSHRFAGGTADPVDTGSERPARVVRFPGPRERRHH